jgi:hypothetical protein
MAANLRTLLIAGGAAAIAAAAAAFVLLRPPQPAGPSPQQPAAAMVLPAAPLPNQSATGIELAPDAAPVGFDHAVKPYSVARETIVYSAPNTAAPHLYPLPAGTPLVSAERSRDGKWIIALTEDGRAAYLLADDLGPFDATQVPERFSLPTIINGTVKVVDTGNLIVSDQNVPLAGVIGKPDPYARDLQALIASQGNIVTCQLQQQSYVCKLPSGVDVARVALLNGAAEPADDASEDYRLQAQTAKAAQRGIWH